MQSDVTNIVAQHMENLPDSDQQQVLDFIRELTTARQQGVLGKGLLYFAGTIPPTDLVLMSQAIEEDCEQVDLNEW